MLEGRFYLHFVDCSDKMPESSWLEIYFYGKTGDSMIAIMSFQSPQCELAMFLASFQLAQCNSAVASNANHDSFESQACNEWTSFSVWSSYDDKRSAFWLKASRSMIIRKVSSFIYKMKLLKSTTLHRLLFKCFISRISASTIVKIGGAVYKPV